MYYYKLLCPCKIVMSAYAFTLSELTAFKNHTSVHNSVFCSTEYERKRVFFIAPSFDSFSFAETSFCILQHLASLSFANPLSIHLMLSFFTVSIFCNKLFASQYSQKVLSFFRTYPILENKRPVSKSVLMIQSYT